MANTPVSLILDLQLDEMRFEHIIFLNNKSKTAHVQNNFKNSTSWLSKYGFHVTNNLRIVPYSRPEHKISIWTCDLARKTPLNVLKSFYNSVKEKDPSVKFKKNQTNLIVSMLCAVHEDLLTLKLTGYISDPFVERFFNGIAKSIFIDRSYINEIVSNKHTNTNTTNSAVIVKRDVAKSTGSKTNMSYFTQLDEVTSSSQQSHFNNTGFYTFHSATLHEDHFIHVAKSNKSMYQKRFGPIRNINVICCSHCTECQHDSLTQMETNQLESASSSDDSQSTSDDDDYLSCVSNLYNADATDNIESNESFVTASSGSARQITRRAQSPIILCPRAMSLDRYLFNRKQNKNRRTSSGVSKPRSNCGWFSSRNNDDIESPRCVNRLSRSKLYENKCETNRPLFLLTAKIQSQNVIGKNTKSSLDLCKYRKRKM